MKPEHDEDASAVVWADMNEAVADEHERAEEWKQVADELSASLRRVGSACSCDWWDTDAEEHREDCAWTTGRAALAKYDALVGETP